MTKNEIKMCVSLNSTATLTGGVFTCPGDGKLYSEASDKYKIERKMNEGLQDDYGVQYKSDLLFADIDMKSLIANGHVGLSATL
jgi:hypothetical protein